ncbi:hypothetical protein Tco_0522269 [Tanacetum coccineum]
MGLLRTELEKVKLEKEGFELKIAKFEKSAKDLDQLIASQITDKSKKGFGYNVVPSPHPLILKCLVLGLITRIGYGVYSFPEVKGWLVEDLVNYHLKELRCSAQCHMKKSIVDKFKRGDGSSKNYKVLKSDPDEEDEIWKNQHEYNLISWRLCDFCGIHILLMQNRIAIHMLTEKKYPLSQEMITKMLNKRLEVKIRKGFEFKIAKFEKSAKDLDQLLASQITDKSKKGFGYNAVPSPHPLILNRPTPLDLSYSGLEEFKEPESDNSKENTDDSLKQQQKTDSKTSSVKSPLKVDKDWKEKFFCPANHVREEEPKKARENNDAPII